MPPIPIEQAFALAQQHLQAGRLAEAEDLYRQILQVAPRHAAAWHFRGLAAWQAGQHEAGLEWMRQSIAIDAGDPAFHDNLGTALRELGRPDEAIACSRRALALDATAPESHHNLGNALLDKGRFEEAFGCFERALSLAPEYATAHAGLGHALRALGLVQDADAAYRRALHLQPGDFNTHSALLLNLHYLEDIDADAISAEHRHWDEVHARPLRHEVLPHGNDPAPGRRLRIGYVSPDFRRHPVGFFVEGLLASHDHAVVEVFCYSGLFQPDAVTARLRQSADHWRDIAGMSDARVAALVREDAIDILVDLAGHTDYPRLLVFARKPAPVQVTWLGYCDTTGLATMDYRITDACADPPGESDHLHTEQLVRLPNSFACFRPCDEAPAISPSPAAQRGHVTFASFHTLAKLNPRLLESWAAILVRVPGARLLLVADGSSARERLSRFFHAHGVEAERLEFRDWQSLPHYLALHGEVDVLLDAHPFSGHTVSCHALWMGVPVISLAGSRHCGRMVASVLQAIGLPELIARTPGEYVQIASELAADQPRLAALRATLRERMASSPLMDAPGFARDVESAYRRMWTAWCDRQPSR